MPNAWTTQSRRNSEQYTIQKQKLMAEIVALRARIKPLTQCPQIHRHQPIDEFGLNMAVHKIKSLIDAVNEAAGKRIIISSDCGKQMLSAVFRKEENNIDGTLTIASVGTSNIDGLLNNASGIFNPLEAVNHMLSMQLTDAIVNININLEIMNNTMNANPTNCTSQQEVELMIAANCAMDMSCSFEHLLYFAEPAYTTVAEALYKQAKTITLNLEDKVVWNNYNYPTIDIVMPTSHAGNALVAHVTQNESTEARHIGYGRAI
jgi:hypothetical protein